MKLVFPSSDVISRKLNAYKDFCPEGSIYFMKIMHGARVLKTEVMNEDILIFNVRPFNLKLSFNKVDFSGTVSCISRCFTYFYF